MEYDMNSVERELFNMIEQDGVKAPISSLIRAFREYAHYTQDLGIKERSRKALEVADILLDVNLSLEED